MLLYRIPEFNIPEVKPAIEVVRGERLQKMSPKQTHGILQLSVGITIRAWAKDRGLVSTECRVYLLPPREKPSSLVPDVAYFSHVRLNTLAKEEREKPPFAPDIAVEILSAGDRKAIVETKIGLYRLNGSSLVIIVDSDKRSVRTIDADADRTFTSGQIARSAAFADFEIDVSRLFEEFGETPREHRPCDG